MTPAPPNPLPDYPVFHTDVVTATVKEAERITGVDERMIRGLMAKRVVRYTRVGKANLVVMSTLIDWLRREYHRNPEPRDVRLTQLRGVASR